MQKLLVSVKLWLLDLGNSVKALEHGNHGRTTCRAYRAPEVSLGMYRIIVYRDWRLLTVL